MKDLIAFVKTRSKTGAFGATVDLVGETTSFGIAIEILGWLKRQNRFQHEKELELNTNYTWCQKLPSLLNADSSLARLFEVINNRVAFKKEISSAERQSLRELADSEYQPVIRT